MQMAIRAPILAGLAGVCPWLQSPDGGVVRSGFGGIAFHQCCSRLDYSSPAFSSTTSRLSVRSCETLQCASRISAAHERTDRRRRFERDPTERRALWNHHRRWDNACDPIHDEDCDYSAADLARQPFPALGDFLASYGNFGHGRSNAFQAQFERRYSHGLMFNCRLHIS